MKKTVVVLAVICFLAACKSTKMATPAPDTVTKPAVDTALQGDKMKDPTKQ